MTALEYLVELHKIDVSEATPDEPIMIPMGRFKDIPRMFARLGYKTGAEIGVYQGDYSRMLLKRNPGLKLYGIDAWESYPGYKDFQANDISEAHQKALDNTASYDCELIKGWSDDPAILARFPDESLDFVFIDGNHAYEYCVRDIALWSRKVKRGGVVYGHDYDDYTNSRRWAEMGVVPAVDGWMKSYRISPWFVITHNRNKCWMYVKS